MDRAADTERIARYRAGDARALEELVEEYRRPLFAYLLRMSARRDEADEVFQEVWLRVIRNVGTYRHKNFFGWLLRIAHNLVIDRCRRRKPEVSLDEQSETSGRSLVETLPDGGMGPSGRMAAADVGRRIAAAVAALPLEQREVFLMRTETDLPFKEIAAIQGTSINTALGRMHYAVGRLRPLLRADYESLGR
jgi:RNA polymerase sigma-70 factor (ECF subfamily)